jgi:hypothetical protein
MKLFALLLTAASLHGQLPDRPLIFPIPQEITPGTGTFTVDANTAIWLPAAPSPRDIALARILVAEIADRFHIAVRTVRQTRAPASGGVILAGSIQNPLVRQYCAQHSIAIDAKKPGPAGYVLHVSPGFVLIAGSDDRGAFYGVQSLRQLPRKQDAQVVIPALSVRDWPHMPFRAIRMYLPGHENVAFYKRFIRDFAALYKYNRVFVEVGGFMRLDRHPEINAGWLDLVNDLHYTERYEPHGPDGVYQNSVHQDAADGEIMEKQEVAELVRFASENFIETVPEIPSLTHAYYLLTRHRELAEIPDAEWPDTYCPLLPKSYDLLFDVMEEYIEVMKPSMVHIGHDEWFVPFDRCSRCKGHNPGELFAADVNRIYAWLKKRNIQVAMYGDYFIESVRGKTYKPIKAPSGLDYRMPGALSPEQVKALIPKDILILNWFWQDARAKDGRGEPNDIKVRDFGFRQVFNNSTPAIENWQRRSTRAGVIGSAPSSWAATNEYNFGKDLLHDFLGCINLMWSTHWPDEQVLSKIVEFRSPDIRRRLSGRTLPSDDGDPVQPVSIARQFTSPDAIPDFDWRKMATGPVTAGPVRFELEGGAVTVGVRGDGPMNLPLQSEELPIHSDVSSILFLHATRLAAANDMAYRYIHNFPDTADLLGYYEVRYEDGFVDTIPIRFGLNIAPYTWRRNSDVIAKGVNPTSLDYTYQATEIDCGTSADNPLSFFSFEWVNPRFGKKVRSVRLHGTDGFTDTKGKKTPSNAIVLAALSVVNKRTDLNLLHALPLPPGGIRISK